MGIPDINKTFYIEQLGCAKNQVDGESLTTVLLHPGFTEVPTPEEADYILVNTCGFIEAAKKESLEVTLELRNRFPQKKIILTGCLSERYGKELFQNLPEVNGVFGNRDLSRIYEVLQRIEKGERNLLIPETYASSPPRTLQDKQKGYTYIKIAEGCRNRCTYCAIPLIRGSLRSRKITEIREEIETFLSLGIRELNLVAQDLGSYGMDLGEKEGEGLIQLLQELQSLPQKFWIRLLYIHPERFPLKVLDLCKADERFLPYFDLPFQHASPSILRAMGRKKDSKAYLELIQQIREQVPSAVLRTTFLVGFPGETNADFEELLRFQEAAQFDWVGVFSYSAEDGTAAAELDKKRSLHVPKRIAKERKKRVESVQESITAVRFDRFIGSTLQVLIEEVVEGEPIAFGRGYMHAPEVDGVVVVHPYQGGSGDFLTVRVIKRNGIDLEAVPIHNPRHN
ncbi:MAG: 30S ribosomal protein S12 methylthiotransferase RimO [Spirochaetales bacterium]